MRFHHTGYLVSRIDKSIASFKLLGYEETSYCDVFIKDDEYRKCQICFLKNGENVIELICPNGKESPVYGLLAKYKNMPYHLCFESDDIEADLQLLQSNGFVIFQEPLIAPAIGDKTVVFLVHRNAGIVELVY